MLLNLKDSTITSLIDMVAHDFPHENIIVKDYWEADLCAIGFTNSTEKKLIYVSTYEKPNDQYFVTVDNVDGKTKETFEDIGYDSLKKLILKYLI